VPERRFEPLAILRTLAASKVRFVVIGGYGAFLHGSSMFTNDADICPDPEPGNLKKLCQALREVDARLRTATEPDGVPFTCDEHFLAQMAMVNLVTRHGDFDLSFRPAASEGYDDLVRSAVDYDIGGYVVKVAALDDIILSKETADRAKDRAVLPQLYALRDEIARDQG
jgi:hypothetical protein